MTISSTICFELSVSRPSSAESVRPSKKPIASCHVENFTSMDFSQVIAGLSVQPA